jgi:hypothetical protein
MKLSSNRARGRSPSRGNGGDEKEKWIVRPKARVVRHPSDEFIPRPSPTTQAKLKLFPLGAEARFLSSLWVKIFQVIKFIFRNRVNHPAPASVMDVSYIAHGHRETDSFQSYW